METREYKENLQTLNSSHHVRDKSRILEDSTNMERY